MSNKNKTKETAPAEQPAPAATEVKTVILEDCKNVFEHLQK